MENIKGLRDVFNKKQEYYKFYHYSENVDGFLSILNDISKLLTNNDLKDFSSELLNEIKVYSMKDRKDFNEEEKILENICQKYFSYDADKICDKLKIFCSRFRDFLHMNTIEKVGTNIFGKYKYRAPMSDVFLKGMIGMGQILLDYSKGCSNDIKETFFYYITNGLNENEKNDFLNILNNKNNIDKSLHTHDAVAQKLFNKKDDDFINMEKYSRKGGFEVEFHTKRLTGESFNNKEQKIEIDNLELQEYQNNMSKYTLFEKIKDGKYTDDGAGKLILNPAVLDINKESVSLEYSTPPRNYEQLKEFSKNFIEFLSDKNASTSTDAGLHVHVSIADYGLPIKDGKLDVDKELDEKSKKNLINLITQYAKYEEYIMENCPFARKADNNFLTATLLSHQGYHKEFDNPKESKEKAFCSLYNKLMECKNIGEMIQVMGLGARVLTIAIRPEFQTIEFRGLPGILDENYISNYVNFCFDIVESCNKNQQYDFLTHKKYESIISTLKQLDDKGVSDEKKVLPSQFSQMSPLYSSVYDIDFLSKQKCITTDPSSMEFRKYISKVNESKTKMAIPTEKQKEYSNLFCGTTTIEKIIEEQSFDIAKKSDLFKKYNVGKGSSCRVLECKKEME